MCLIEGAIIVHHYGEVEIPLNSRIEILITIGNKSNEKMG